MTFVEIAALILAILAIVGLLLSFKEIEHNRRDIAAQKKQINHQLYEVLILREISERIGYELNPEKILKTILESLSKLLPFSLAGFVTVSTSSEKPVIWIKVAENIGEKTLNSFLEKLVAKYGEVLGKTFSLADFVVKVDGVATKDEADGQVKSLWVTKLSINSRALGAMAIANTKPGLYLDEEMTVLDQILNYAGKAVSRLETLLASEQEKLNALIFSLSDGIFLFDNEGNKVVSNPAADKISQGVGNLNTLSLVLMGQLDLKSRFMEAISANNVVIQENILLKDRYYRLILSPAKDAYGKIIGGIVLFHDETLRKELERVRDEFTAMMVHELRTPLAVVRGTANMILADPALASRQEGKDLLVSMESTSGTMLNLVNDLLDVAKIEAGKFTVNKTVNNLVDVVTDRVNFFKPLASSKNIQVSVGQVDTLKPFLFDKDRISQVLTNLLGNALKFTNSNGQVTLSVKMEDNNSVRVMVNDTGVGIPAEKIGELFNKFKQLGQTSGGTGLGLVIAKGIVEAHGGRIMVESKEGQGSTFSIILPLDN